MRLSALILAGATSLVVAIPATAARVEHFKIGNWDGGAYTHTKTGKFNHCAASAGYRNGNTLTFAIYRDRAWALGISNRGWKLTVGDTYPVRYRIDNGTTLSGTAGTIAADQIKIPLPGDNSLFNRMRHGRLLTVVLKSETTKFKLTSTGEVLSKLFNCVDKWRKRREYR